MWRSVCGLLVILLLLLLSFPLNLNWAHFNFLCLVLISGYVAKWFCIFAVFVDKWVSLLSVGVCVEFQHFQKHGIQHHGEKVTYFGGCLYRKSVGSWNLTVTFACIIRIPIFTLIRVEVSLQVWGVYYARVTECFLKVIVVCLFIFHCVIERNFELLGKPVLASFSFVFYSV